MELLRSERIVDKLKLLEYQKYFLPKYRKVGIRAISRHYFAVEKTKNAIPQFYTFACVGYWLCEVCERPMDIPAETDDPMEILGNLVQEAKSIGVKSLDFPVPSLRSGYGENCLFLLEGLLDHALAFRSFKFDKPCYPEADDIETLQQTTQNTQPSYTRSESSLSKETGSIVDEVEARQKRQVTQPHIMPEDLSDDDENLEDQPADLDYLLNRENTNSSITSKSA